jgi:hypothetical protein
METLKQYRITVPIGTSKTDALKLIKALRDVTVMDSEDRDTVNFFYSGYLSLPHLEVFNPKEGRWKKC